MIRVIISVRRGLPAAQRGRPMGPGGAGPRFDWFIPIDGDGVRLGTLQAERPPTFDYLREVVQTAERQGFASLLIPTRFVNGLFDEGAPLAETWTIATV